MKKKITFFALLFLITMNFSGQTQTETQKLLPSNISNDQRFGSSVAISGNKAIVGAKFDDINGGNSGAAYIYKYDGSNWVEEAVISASDGVTNDQFGLSVDISGNKAIVGSMVENNTGAAYIFEYDGVNWIEKKKIIGSDTNSYDFFGESVAISENKAIVGARRNDNLSTDSGAAYIFNFNGTEWEEEIKLISTNSATLFGSSVAISDNKAFIGGGFYNLNAPTTGYVYVYDFNGSAWIQEAILTGSDSSNGDSFGVSLSTDSDKLIVGSLGDRNNVLNNGSAYIFKFNGSEWIEEDKVIASDDDSYDYFGYSVGISGEKVIVGAYSADVNAVNSSGSAYYYRFDGSNWIEESKLFASDAVSRDRFGISVGISGDVIIGGLFSGGAYTYNVSNVNNSLPTVINVTFSGKLTVRETLSGTYVYADNDTENGSTYQWYRSEDNLGTNKTTIANATAQSYILTSDDVNKYISFEVTPNDGTDFGASVESALQGPIVNYVIPAAQSDWQTVGVEGFSASNSSHQRLALDSNNIPYVVFREGNNPSIVNKITVMKFEGNSWVDVGNATFSTLVSSGTELLSIELDNNDVPYVAFWNRDSSGVSVIKFNGVDWEYVGTPLATTYNSYEQSLKFDSNNTPYLASVSNIPPDFKAKISVNKFDGNNWVLVGTEGFVSGRNVDLEIDKNNIPYLAFQDIDNSNTTSVMKFDFGNWSYVGNAGFSVPSSFDKRTIEIDSNNIPYISILDNNLNVIVMRYVNNNWENVGNTISDGLSLSLDLKINSNDIPYVAYIDVANSEIATVKKFNGANWGSTGINGVSEGSAVFNSLAISNNNELYLAFNDIVNNRSTTIKTYNTAPTANTVFITGNLNVEEELTGNYNYSDINNDTENGSTYQWYRSEDNVGTNKTTIANATSQTYVLTSADVNKYISFEVTPNDGTNFGLSVESDLQGAVEAISVNTFLTAKADVVTIAQNSTNNEINVFADNGSGLDDYGANGPLDGGLTMVNGTLTGLSEQGTISIENKTTPSPLDDVIIYTPKVGYVGVDHFYYMITDATGKTAISQVTVTVTQIATPTAVADPVSVIQDSNLISIDVLANDSFGSDGAAVAPSITLTSVSSAGSTIDVNSEKVDYTPFPGFSGTDTFSYTITDATGDVSAPAVVTVTVSAAGTSNVLLAQDDAVTVTQNSVDYLINILDDNGSGVDSFGSDGPNANHPISLSAFYTDHGGKLELDGNVVKYTPRTGYIGVDSFNYTLTDLNGDGDAATVTITVNSIPLVLTAVNDAVTVVQDSGATNILVLSNDVLVAGTSITAFDVTNSNGGVILDDNQTPADDTDDFLTYTPDTGYTGTDTFTYTISDGVDSSTATVTVNVDSAAVIPGVLAAKADAFTVAQYSTNVELNVFAENGSGADTYGTAGPKDGGLTLINGTLIGATEQGNVTIDDKGTPSPLDDRIVYTPNANYAGVDHFYYMITAVDGNTAIAQVTITVTPTALTTITAVDDALTVDFNSENNIIDIFANDPGVRNLDNSANINVDNYAFGAFSNGGSIQIVDGGTIGFNDDFFSYTPADGYSGTETVTYTITYNTVATTTATITFTVSPTTSVNGVPTAQDDAVSVLLNSTNNVINILDDNGSGADSFGTDGPMESHNPISLFGAQTDQGGDIVIDGNTIKYTPKTGFIGTDKFRYRITDKTGDASQAEVTITITIPKSQEEGSNGSSSFNNEFSVYPNPSKGDINIIVFSDKSEQVSMLLFDVTGKVVYRNQQELSLGKNVIGLNLKVKAGIIFLKVYSKETNYGIKKVVFK